MDARVASQLRPYMPPTDPSIYSDVYPENPHSKIKEVASLMTEWYDLLVKMRYVNAQDIAYPPHISKPINTKHAAEFGLVKDVVDLMQMMPYHIAYGSTNWNHGSDAGEFLFWGEFGADMRDEDADWFHNIVDPFYGVQYVESGDPVKGFDEEDGLYMRPWYLALNQMGNHGSLLILNTKDFNMWLVDQMGSVTDPALRDAPQKKTANRNDLSQYPSRPATELLRDMIDRIRTLEYVPGGLYGPEHQEYQVFKDMYISAGWPDNFDGAIFDHLRAEREQFEQDRHRAEQPLEELKTFKQWAQNTQDQKKWYHDTVAALEALPPDADPEKRKELEDTRDRTGQRFLPEGFAKQQDEYRTTIAERKMKLQTLLEENPDVDREKWEENRVAWERRDHERVIAALEEELEYTSFEDRDRKRIEKAQIKADLVDPAIRKAWEERVAKYGY